MSDGVERYVFFPDLFIVPVFLFFIYLDGQKKLYLARALMP